AAGQHTVKTSYMEGVGSAAVFSDVVPFDNWLAYYYSGENPSGPPVAAKTIKPSAENGLLEDNGLGSPMPGQIGSDHFSARYVTAKRLPAGEYVLRGRADDGIRVRVDGKLVLDRWSASGYREDAVKISVSDNPTDDDKKNVHWIEVEYLELTGASKVELTVTPYSDVLKYSSAVGTFFNNPNGSGDGVVVGGANSLNSLNGIAFNWGSNAPMPSIGSDNFSAVFYENRNVTAGDYFIQTFADDNVRVEVDGKPVIDRWSGYTAQADRAIVPNMAAGQHTVKTSYMEGGGDAGIFSHLVPFDSWLAYYYPSKNPTGIPTAAKVMANLSDNSGLSSPFPGIIPDDNFSARYVTAKHMPAGRYKILTKSDDGVRVYVDGKLVINRWTATVGDEGAAVVEVVNSTTETNASLQDVHWIEVEYYEGVGSSFVSATVEPTTLAVTPPPPVAVPNGAYKSAKIYKANGGKQTDYIDGYNTYDEAVRAAADNGANAVLNNDRVVWVNNGFAYADDITINIYSAPGSGNALTYVARSTELKVEAVEGDWVKVRLADTIGYVQKDKVVLVPKDAADSSYFTVKNGDLYYYISHNGWYDMQLYGKAPSFLTPGEKYYSVNGHEFNGQEAYQYFQYLSAHTKTNYTAEELNAYVSQVKPESPLKDLGAAFKKAEADYNVNAMMLLAIAIHESNYGLNRYAGDYRNIFSINATDRNTSENAFVYPTYEACIEEMAKNYMGLGKRYSNPADWRYEGAYLGDKSTGMNVQYASDADWGSGIASVMYQIDRKLGGKDWGKYSLVKPTADTLNVRPAASTSQAVLYQVNNSMVLTKLGDEADWTKIIADVPVSITGSNGEPAAYTATQYARILSIIR
ncbi:PA14 domain-containing protein, partial [Ectobacillus panaciterrae]|uniref:PA14 domain-containing protein n=1 Tax=Ectobacillus panaciterrae TaxID=363872 RepID=UPI0006876EAD